MWARGAILALVVAAAPARAETVALEVVRSNASVDPTSNEPVVLITLSPRSATRLAELTRTNVGRQIRISFRGEVLASPFVIEPILGPSLQISGRFTTKAAEALAVLIGAAGSIDVEPWADP